MLSENEERLLDEVTSLAKHAAPPHLDARDAEEMVHRAALRTLTKRGHASRRRSAVLGGSLFAAAAAVLVVAFTGSWARAPERAETSTVPTAVVAEPDPADPMVLSLPTGDRLTAIEGSHFELLSVTDDDRRVSLSDGAMIFDVAPVRDGARFEVITNDVVVRVVGTVFGVYVDEEGTTVRVYEGRVEIVRDGEVRYLDAGEALGTGETMVDDARLATVGRNAAEARSGARAIAFWHQEAALGSDERSDEEPEPAPAHAAAVFAPQPTVAETRGLISSGDAEQALSTARLALAGRPDDVAFRLVEADALRALRRYAEAAEAFDRAAADAGSTAEGRGAGYRAAVIRRANLGDAEGALDSLDAARVDVEGSPFEERGLALRARALSALGREAEIRAVAERYLASFPTGSTRSFMEQLVRAPDEDEL